MNNYYKEVEHLAKKFEVNKITRKLQDNSEQLETYWNIGKLIVEAQGGEKRAKYGNELIKEWSTKLTKKYGKGYSERNLKRFRKFYFDFLIGPPVVAQLTWSHLQILNPIKDINKRNYYINICIERSLSKRELINEIKNNAYERLLNKPEKIELLFDKVSKSYNIKEQIRNPIVIKLEDNEKVLKEKDLQVLILAKLKTFFMELGSGYAFIGNEYKIHHGSKDYYIDILLFNVEVNAYVVVELKTRELRYEDKAQISFYIKLLDEHLRRDFHNKTIGIIVSKEQDKYIVSFVSDTNVIPITYKLEEII